MTPLRRLILQNTFKVFDVLVMIFSFVTASIAAHSGTNSISLGDFFAMRISVQNFALFLVFLFAWHYIFHLFGHYRSRRLSSQWGEIVDVLSATSFGTMAIFVAANLFDITLVSPLFLVIFWSVSSIVTILSRIILKYMLRKVRLHGRNLRHILIAGTNKRALSFARKIEKKAELGYRFIGFVDDKWVENGNSQKSDHHQLIHFKDFADFLKDNVVDEVVVCLPFKSFYRQTYRIIAICEKQGITVRLFSDIFDMKLGRLRMEQFEDDSMMITVSTGAMEGLPILMKRTLDILASLIKLTSAGPVFFVQERVGLNKRRFHLYKFRTMIPDAEQKLSEIEHLNEISGPVFKIKNDPRITFIGKFLRKTSIDELPQLFNVLKGDMSLVGPRPLPVRDYEGFDQEWHRRRFSVRPGITCIWQVNGRSNIPFEKWMELDMQYIDRWSLWLDFKILAKTIPEVIKGSGAG